MSDPLVPLVLNLLDRAWPADLADRRRWFDEVGFSETSSSLDPSMSYGMLETGVPGVHAIWQGSNDRVTGLEVICSYGDGVAHTRTQVLDALTQRLGTPSRSTFFTDALKVWLSRVQDGIVTVQYSTRG